MTELIPAWQSGRLRPVGKMEVHRLGLRHKAVSVFLLAAGEMLIQKRAAGKYHTPGLWANACCTHPLWGEAPGDCAVRRLGEELGIAGLRPEPRGRIEYRADVGNGMTEHEVVDLFVAEVPRDIALRPDPAEVAAVRWVGFAELMGEISAAPATFTPWLRIYMRDHAAAILGAGTAAQ
ncbi:MAG: isopentenyl-diphosphate Delta-isomerase [Rhodobacteraceae bacterium]|nr:isopentenyl-diphosphate Delta-isomerase [Paracoccaceae bacterium]